MNIPRNDMRQAMQEQPCAAFKAMGATPYACRNNPDECHCKKNGIINNPQAKPIVKFSEIQSSIAIGQRVFVKPLDHPSEYVSNTRWALTTCVQSFVSNGKGIESFETENTRYVKA
jgi:hypothetical protein